MGKNTFLCNLFGVLEEAKRAPCELQSKGCLISAELWATLWCVFFCVHWSRERSRHFFLFLAGWSCQLSPSIRMKEQSGRRRRRRKRKVAKNSDSSPILHDPINLQSWVRAEIFFQGFSFLSFPRCWDRFRWRILLRRRRIRSELSKDQY